MIFICIESNLRAYQRDGCAIARAGDSSFEIPWQDVAGLVEAGEITAETLVFSDQSAYPFDEWVAWSQASHCFGSSRE